ncbi:hypothetical protein M569_00764 [Genlisea aurea]|uniref:DUF632 domain-containing protein n=1 Tax=Genlisea aurea TaxID=192259 RepID=S8D2N9_9LAMI|nr:hypothetical protein M569_00764 [Genlisea aurea]
MGCSGSKVDDLPLVIRCRERRDLIRAAAHHRYAFAAAHVSYFRSLKDFGDALRKFVDEDLIASSASSSSTFPSPSLVLPPASKRKKASQSLKNKDEGSHIHLSESPSSSSSSSSSEDGDSDQLHHRDEFGGDLHRKTHTHAGEGGVRRYLDGVQEFPRYSSAEYPNGDGDSSIYNPYHPYPPPPPYGEPYSDQWDPQGGPPRFQPWYYPSSSNVYYMKKSAPMTKRVLQEPPTEPATGYSGLFWNPPVDYAGTGYGYVSGSMGNEEGGRENPVTETPPPPSPKSSAWDFFNPFNGYENPYPEFYSSARYTNRSSASSPGSSEVREREGIPDLEEETESEVYKEIILENNRSKTDSRKVSARKSTTSSRARPNNPPARRKAVHFTNVENVVSKSMDEASVKKKEVTFDVEETSKNDGDSSKRSSITLLSSPRDLKGVVAEIRDEFETASTYGKEVAMLLEVGKQPYERKFLKELLFRAVDLITPSTSVHDPLTWESASRKMKLETPYFEDDRNGSNSKACTLSSTLDKLYAWEKKLYKEVKVEERLRVMYEKQYQKLRALDAKGAETSKIDAARSSIRRLLTKLEMSIKAIDAISSRIHKLRDEELQPQIAEIIYGLIRMWKAMLECHQKQFRAIMESKMRRLKAITSLETDSSSRASTELERELRVWCKRFNDWIGSQKSYLECLNGWLLRCLHYEPEETPDGQAPYSPSKLGAPPIFVICNDWKEAMKAISEARVANAMNTFATSLRQLWEKQDEEGRQRLKAEYLKRDYEKQVRAHHHHEATKIEDGMSGGLSMVPSDNGATSPSPVHDDDDDGDFLSSMKQRVAEEQIKHKDAMKLVQDAASSSLQGGLIPIFKALESFTSEALKAHQHVRLQQVQSR